MLSPRPICHWLAADRAGPPPLLAAAASAALTLALSRNAIACLRIVDHPNERSLHRTPVPRTGGVGVIFGGA
jgi:UDP-N-acetylmuramyl pentapeptide phosphotransferase/UDP-N-acetylglucosamine-1-phosphate transferase